MYNNDRTVDRTTEWQIRGKQNKQNDRTIKKQQQNDRVTQRQNNKQKYRQKQNKKKNDRQIYAQNNKITDRETE